MRVHEPLSVLDLFDTGPCTHSWPLPKALAAVQASQRGVAVLLNCGESADALLARLKPHEAGVRRKQSQVDLRTYGIGSQILRELGVSRMKLLGNPRRMPSMVGYGLEVTSFVASTD